MARIFDIKHFAVHDGPGIRTTVFFSGCPLRCLWCHNPEGLVASPRLALHSEKCTLCKSCEGVCEHSVHSFSDGHLIDRKSCVSCKKCADICPNSALTLYGRDIGTNELLPELLEDRDFYGENGGVTLSGGECLLQSEFCAELEKKLKAEGINTAIDTSGAVDRAAIDAVLPYTDIFLYDIKAIDRDVHKSCTGRTNEDILRNLLYLDSVGAKIEIRVPYVPGYNDGEIERIGEFLATLKTHPKVRLLAYHRFYESKYEALGYLCPPDIEPPTAEMLEKAKSRLSSFGIEAL